MKDYSRVNSVFIANTFKPGSKKSGKLIEDLKDIIDLDFSDLKIHSQLSAELKEKFSLTAYQSAIDTVDYCISSGYGILSFADEDYPTALKSIENPPAVLYYRGKFPDFNNYPSVTIAGPRRPTELGQELSYRLSSRFSLRGITVVSGGGTGCEFEALKGATDSRKTVIILPCGIDCDVLKYNPGITRDILENACVISEFAPKTPQLKYNYILRNRILAAISDITVLIEAPEGSGALITAEKSLEFGKTVYAIPGNLLQNEYKGSNKLFLKGAKPFVDDKSVFNDFETLYPGKIGAENEITEVKGNKVTSKFEKNNIKSQETLSKEAKMLYNYLDRQIFSVEDFSSLELTANEILSALTELELEQFISALPGGKYKIL